MSSHAAHEKLLPDALKYEISEHRGTVLDSKPLSGLSSLPRQPVHLRGG